MSLLTKIDKNNLNLFSKFFVNHCISRNINVSAVNRLKQSN